MTSMWVWRGVAVGLVAIVLVGAGMRPAAAALPAGEYACSGAGGTILSGLGFRLRADGTYTDLDGNSSGRVSYSGSTVTFIGGHLAGQVGRNIRGSNFEIGSISCSKN